MDKTKQEKKTQEEPEVKKARIWRNFSNASAVK